MNPTPKQIDDKIQYSRLRVRLNPLTLAFAGSNQFLEASFRSDYFINSLDHVRRCKLYAILFFGIFGILDAYVFPEQKIQLWFIRYVVVCPVFLVGLIFSYTDAYRRFWQPINAVYILVTGYAYVAMVLITPEPERFFLWGGDHFLRFLRLHLRPCAVYYGFHRRNSRDRRLPGCHDVADGGQRRDSTDFRFSFYGDQPIGHAHLLLYRDPAAQEFSTELPAGKGEGKNR